jgi:hypothetical protein
VTRALFGAGWLVLFVTGLFALYMLFVGLTFGFALWDAANPKPTVMWLGVLAAPIVVAIGLSRRVRSPITLTTALVIALALDGAWIIPTFQ